MRTYLSFVVLSIIALLHSPQPTHAQGRTYASRSVLSEGEWYKIGVTRAGVYRLDRQFLSQLGLNPGSFDPRNLRLYGNGGGMLPQPNSAPRHDDLLENPIVVQGEEDGRFDEGDAVLFYGDSPHQWQYEADADAYTHRWHLYADTNYYFLTVANEPGKRIQPQTVSGTPTNAAAACRGLAFHERDVENPEKSGRYWLGEGFSGIVNERSFAFGLQDRVPEGEVRVRLRLAANADRTTSFRVLQDGQLMGTLSISRIQNSATAPAYLTRTHSYTLPASAISGDSLRLRIEYNASGDADARAWLDWVEVDYDRDIARNAQDMFWFALPAAGSEPLRLRLSSEAYTLWNITQPVNVQAVPLQQAEAVVAAEQEQRYLAFKGGFLRPTAEGRVPNQNLHGLDLADYLIITHPVFRGEAERLAQFHRDHYGRSVHVVTPQEIYHEFSSGKRDVSAMRDFVKMFYDQSSGLLPGFVLLFGDGTYDYKGLLKDPNTQQPLGRNFVPTYQSRNSWSPVSSYTSDDFFVILDDEEGFWGENARIAGDPFVLDNDKQVDLDNLLDAAVGRLPVETPAQARLMVDKIIDYATNPEGFGSWRNKVVLVADHFERDHSTHISQADSYTNVILSNNACVNLEKIYMDNYPAESTPNGIKFPKGKEALLGALDEGSLLVNYTGHGGEDAWSHADILLPNDIQNIQNAHRLPAYITATCSFGHYDDPETRSGAETLLLMGENRGSIAMLTTVRLVYSSPNATLNANLYREIFTFDEEKGRMPTVGEVMKRTKNRTFSRGSTTNINSRNFTLLGDPGLILNYPRLNARITALNDLPLQQGQVDTLRSLSKVEVQGVVEDPFGNRISSYEGEIAITVFDKPSQFTTRLSPFSFSWQKNRIFNGTASVKDGQFTFSFVVPIDISYEEGTGKISLYFSGTEGDGGGCFTNMYLGGTEVAVIPDTRGPEIQLFINDEHWIDGGITDANPYLYALVSDSSGINTVGSAIGHEIIGILDQDEANAFTLNEHYTAKKDSYSEGEIWYQMRKLEEGEHELMLRVWDGANNPSEARTTFIVARNEKMVLDRILNVPNPFQHATEFRIGHNQAGKDLEATVRIYSLAGQLVKELKARFFATGNQYSIEWDGQSEAGTPINNGMYLYQVLLKNPETGQEAMEVRRMLLMR